MRRGTKGAWDRDYDCVEIHVGANVAKYRKRKGISQEYLAERIGLQVKSLQRMEYGKGNCTARVLFALANELGVTPNDFFQPCELVKQKRGRPRKTTIEID